ncbi:MAG: hypothetical protein RXR20_20520 [Paraburkholderia sp.]|jgi:hypothetical protein
MYCVHLCPNPPALPVAREEYHWLPVAGNQVLLIHPDCHHCGQPSTRLPHVLAGEAVGTTVATALAAFGVVESDTLLHAMLKVAPSWAQAWP